LPRLKRELQTHNSTQKCALMASKPKSCPFTRLSKRLSATSLKRIKLNYITITFTSTESAEVVRALGYSVIVCSSQVKNWTVSYNCICRKYLFVSGISYVLSENTIVIDCPFVYLATYASERAVSPQGLQQCVSSVLLLQEECLSASTGKSQVPI
jgi:hypothetical protein